MSRRFPSATGPIVGALGGLLVGILDGRARRVAGRREQQRAARERAARGRGGRAAGSDRGLAARASCADHGLGLARGGSTPRARIVAWVFAGAVTAARGARPAWSSSAFATTAFSQPGSPGWPWLPSLPWAPRWRPHWRARSPLVALTSPGRPTSSRPRRCVTIRLRWPWSSASPSCCCGRRARRCTGTCWRFTSRARSRSARSRPGSRLGGARRCLRLRWPAALALAALLFLVPAIVALALSWADNLRFAPWIDIGAGAAIARRARLAPGCCAAAGPARAPRGSGSRPPRLRSPSSCCCRSARPRRRARRGAARTGLVAPLLAIGRAGARLRSRRLRARCSAAATATTAIPASTRRARDPRRRHRSGLQRRRRDRSRCRRRRASPPCRRRCRSDLNVLLITIDTLRADHLGCYGYTRADLAGARRAGRRGRAVRERLGARAVDALLDARDPAGR